MAMGFLAPIERPSGNACSPEEALFTFDSGRTISFAEAVRSTLVLGGTGSGKTCSVMLPVLDALLRAGFGGLVLDVKGNLGDQTRTLARACGRGDDVVEFGSGPQANHTNLLAGLSNGALLELFSGMSIAGCEHDLNVSWLFKGGRLAADVAITLKALSSIGKRSEFSRRLTPTLRSVLALLTDRALARGVWKYYCRELDRLHRNFKNDPVPSWYMQAQAFYEEVSAQRFHVFYDDGEKADFKGNETEFSQLSWMLQGITRRLKEIRETHGLMERFSCLEAHALPLDFGELIYRRNKVVLVHFGPDCGRAGAMLSRIIKERFYESLYRYGLRRPAGRYTFMLGDEFQNIIDVSSRRLSDRDLFSVSREFGNINVIATQSVSSLLAAGSADAVDSLLANCTNKIFLQTRDLRTIHWAEDFFGADVGIGKLGRGDCRIDMITESGEPLKAADGVNAAFAKTCGLLTVPPAAQKKRKERPSLLLGVSGLPRRMERYLRVEKHEAAWGAEMLDRMRRLSCRGGDCWNMAEPPRPEKPEPKQRADWRQRRDAAGRARDKKR